MSEPARLYFDHNASTPADPRVLRRFLEVEGRAPANPGSLHGSGRAARAVLEDARERVAALCAASPEHVVFVSGGTEANNLAVLGLGDPALPVLCAAVEHPSAWEPAGARGRVEAGVDRFGYAEFAPPPQRVGLIAVVHGQSEIGTVQPVAAAADLARRLGVPLHVDAAQTPGRIDLREVIGVADTVALSAHKFGGLRGGGFLVGPGVPRLAPMLRGGAQELGVRAGTPATALAAANALAFELACTEWPARAAAMAAARDAFEAGLAAAEPMVLTPRATSLPNTAMCRFAGVDGRSLLPALDRAGVEASAGSACSSGAPTPPRVLRAIGLDEAAARCCVRFSFSHHTTLAEAREGAQRVVDVVSRLRR